MESDPRRNAPADDGSDVGESARRSPTRRGLVAGAAVLVLAIWLLAAWRPWSSPTPTPTPASVRAGDSVDGSVAPLTGIPVSESDSVRLLRPALIAKIDGAPEAMPQKGLESADMVIEARVEGISRYLGVWHSQDVAQIGPVRSARTTDPDLLAAFARPLFSYSGGNTGVLTDLRRSDWFTDVSHDAVPAAYLRSSSRVAPHDLMADTADLRDRTPEDLAIPPAQFAYDDADAPKPEPGSTDARSSAAPAPGFAVAVGSDARFVWDDEASAWRRWAHGVAHLDPGGEPLHFDNVVVVEVDYVRSAADPESPEAVSVGSGSAWVFGPGTVRAGTWDRPVREAGWNLADESGDPLALSPGTTWIVLVDSAPLPLDEREIAGLLDDG